MKLFEKVTRVKNGHTYEFELDWEFILQEEAKNPNYSIMDDLEWLQKRFRLSSVQKVAKMIGYEWENFVIEGFNFGDLILITMECMKVQGFMPSEESEESLSSDQTDATEEALHLA